LGEWLQQRREELGISLEQAELDTRIRLRYLEALESEEYDALPDPVVGRGFLRNYATYLELDPKEASDRFSKIVAPPQPESLAVEGTTPFTAGPFRPVPLHEIPGRGLRRWWPVALALILVISLSLLAWWAYPWVAQWLARQEAGVPAVTATQRVTRADLPTATRTRVSTAVAMETVSSAQASATLELSVTPTRTSLPSPTPSPPIYTGIFLELVFTDTSWIQITVDGVRQSQGELEADTYRSWYGEERIELRVGNAGAVLVTVNGQSLGTLGAKDEVVDRVFEKVGDDVTEATVTSVPTGEQTAVPTPAPATPTTAPPTPTLAPTTSLTPTVTITPTPGP
jgi:cytoskeletal protein RodZ